MNNPHLIANNIISEVSKSHLYIFREDGYTGDITIDNNILWQNGNPVTIAISDDVGTGAAITNTIEENPMFVDPANGDFRLKSDSPALKLGFIPIDVSKIGLRKHE